MGCLGRVAILGLLLVGAGAAQPASVALFHKGAIRALILSGRNNHDWRETTPALRQLLVETGRFDVRVNEEPAGMTPETLAAYQVVVLDYNGPRWGIGAEKALEEFVARGGGLVVVHGAGYAFSGLPVLGDGHVRMDILEPAWTEYARMIGGVWCLDAPATSHAPRHTFTVKFVDREHPVAQGVGTEFVTNDELYHQLRMREDAHVLATAFDDAANKWPNGKGGTGRDEPVLWTVAYGKGRVFHTTLGHDAAAMRNPGFRATFTRGVEWAATGGVIKVTE